MQELSYLDKIILVSIWCRMTLTQIIAWIYKIKSLLNMSTKYQYFNWRYNFDTHMLVVWYHYPVVWLLIPNNSYLYPTSMFPNPCLEWLNIEYMIPNEIPILENDYDMPLHYSQLQGLKNVANAPNLTYKETSPSQLHSSHRSSRPRSSQGPKLHVPNKCFPMSVLF